MMHYDWTRLLQSGKGRMEFDVVGREITYGDQTFKVGDPWPPVDVSDKAKARIARLFYNQRRLAPNPAWMLKNVPGAEKWMTAEEKAAADKSIAAELAALAAKQPAIAKKK